MQSAQDTRLSGWAKPIHNFLLKTVNQYNEKKLKITSNLFFVPQIIFHPFNAVTTERMNWIIWGGEISQHRENEFRTNSLIPTLIHILSLMAQECIFKTYCVTGDNLIEIVFSATPLIPYYSIRSFSSDSVEKVKNDFRYENKNKLLVVFYYFHGICQQFFSGKLWMETMEERPKYVYIKGVNITK